MEDVCALVFEGNAIRTVIDLRSYRLIAVKKAAYTVAEKCTVTLGAPDADRLPIVFLFRPGTLQPAAMEAARRFFQELLDQELREAVAEETNPLRALILAQAFSKTDLVRRE